VESELKVQLRYQSKLTTRDSHVFLEDRTVLLPEGHHFVMHVTEMVTLHIGVVVASVRRFKSVWRSSHRCGRRIGAEIVKSVWRSSHRCGASHRCGDLQIEVNWCGDRHIGAEIVTSVWRSSCWCADRHIGAEIVTSVWRSSCWCADRHIGAEIVTIGV
jgi:hypothetical protein